MKVHIGKHDFSEFWDGVYYKALSEYPRVSDNEMRDILDFISYQRLYKRSVEIEADRPEILEYVLREIQDPEIYRARLAPWVPELLQDRVHYLEHRGMDVWQWAEKAYSYVFALT